MTATDYPVIHFADRAAWAAWLDANHASAAGVWVRIAKAASNVETVTRDEALDVALCYGWIDGQARSHDEDSWLQKFTPRKARSLWSKRNREIVERLIASGEMRAAGLAAIEAAKADGRWDRAYDSPANATVPDDFAAALEANPAAKTFFESLKRTDRYPFIYRIQTAVRPDTRARRIAQFTELLARGEKLG